MGVLLTYIIVNITISEHVELNRTVNAVSESKNIHKKGLENTVVCHFPMLENAHFLDQNSPNCIWRPGFVGQTFSDVTQSRCEQ